MKICSYSQRFSIYTQSGRLVKNILRRMRRNKEGVRYILYNKTLYKVYDNSTTPLNMESMLPHIVLEGD
jgi:hypothetical protein